MVARQHDKEPAHGEAEHTAGEGLDGGAAGAQRAGPQNLERPQHDPEGVAQAQRPRQQHRQRQADRQPEAVVEDRRPRLEVGAHRSPEAEHDPGGAGASGDGGRQGDLRVEPFPGGDHGVAAQPDRQVGDDAQRVVVVDAIEDLLGRPTLPQLPGRPTIERVAVDLPRPVQGAQVGRCPAGQDRGARPQRVEHRRGQAIALRDPGPSPNPGFREWPLGEVADLVQLGEELEVGAISPGQPGGPPGQRGVFLTGDLHRPACLVERSCEGGTAVQDADHLGDRHDRLRRPLRQAGVLGSRPEKRRRERRKQARQHPAADPGGDGGGRPGEGERDHESQQQPRPGSRDVAAEDARESKREADHQHRQRGASGGRGGQRPERDHHRADEGCSEVGERPRGEGAAEVRHDQQRKTAEDDEDQVLRVADDKPSEEEGRGDDESRPCAPAEGDQAGIGRLPEPQPGSPRERAPGLLAAHSNQPPAIITSSLLQTVSGGVDGEVPVSYGVAS